MKHINRILHKYGKSPLKAYDQQTIGAFILDKFLNHNKSQSVSESTSAYNLLSDLLANRLIDANDIKNFLNQTLLHISCEQNATGLCDLLLKYGADCLLEDNYRCSPFLISAKQNLVELNKLFAKSIQRRSSQLSLESTSDNETLANFWEQIRRAAYYSVCFGHLEISEYLFQTFELHSEQICTDFVATCELDSLTDERKARFSELNPLHVAAYKANLQMVEFLFQNTQSLTRDAFKNAPLNEYRDCTPLEEAFKGLIMLGSNLSTHTALQQDRFKYAKISADRNKKRHNHLRIIDLLIVNGCRFSLNFILNNGLSKMLLQIFSGAEKDTDFVQFLYGCNFLFKYKLNEIFSLSNSKSAGNEDLNTTKTNVNTEEATSKYNRKMSTELSEQLQLQTFSLTKMIEDFLLNVYTACLKVIKDFKGICLNYFVEILLNLHFTGQMYLNMNKLAYLKEKNSEVYAMLEQIARKPLTLKSFCCMSIRESIRDYGLQKIDSFLIPVCLKNEIFYNSISKTNYKKNHFYPNLI